MLERIEGIVIKAQDYGESHKIVTIFSGKIGKFSAIARGAKKPKSRMAAVTQPFIHGQFLVYVSTGLSTIQQGEIVNSLRSIREDIIKTAYVAYITELTDKLIESHTPDKNLYDQFYITINWIADNREVEIPVIMYELKLFKRGGFAPILESCVHCRNKKNPTFFSITEGGLLCSNCVKLDKHAISLPVPLARLLSLFADTGLERIGRISIKPENQHLLRNILDAYYDQYGGYQLKSRRFLKQLDLLK